MQNSVKFSTKVSTAKKVKKPGPNASAVLDVLNKIETEKQKKDEEFAQKRRVSFFIMPILIFYKDLNNQAFTLKIMQGFGG